MLWFNFIPAGSKFNFFYLTHFHALPYSKTKKNFKITNSSQILPKCYAPINVMPAGGGGGSRA